MSGPNAELHARYEYLVREYERTRKGVLALRQTLAGLRGRGESEDGLVSVRLGARGEVEALELNPRVYRRLTPTELAETILATIRKAGQSLAEQAAAAYAPFLPAGMSYERLMAADADPPALLPEQPVTDDTFDEWWASWSGVNRPGAGR